MTALEIAALRMRQAMAARGAPVMYSADQMAGRYVPNRYASDERYPAPWGGPAPAPAAYDDDYDFGDPRGHFEDNRHARNDDGPDYPIVADDEPIVPSQEQAGDWEGSNRWHPTMNAMYAEPEYPRFQSDLRYADDCGPGMGMDGGRMDMGRYPMPEDREPGYRAMRPPLEYAPDLLYPPAHGTVSPPSAMADPPRGRKKLRRYAFEGDRRLPYGAISGPEGDAPRPGNPQAVGEDTPALYAGPWPGPAYHPHAIGHQHQSGGAVYADDQPVKKKMIW